MAGCSSVSDHPPHQRSLFHDLKNPSQPTVMKWLRPQFPWLWHSIMDVCEDGA
jgi:hypothetical protein